MASCCLQNLWHFCRVCHHNVMKFTIQSMWAILLSRALQKMSSHAVYNHVCYQCIFMCCEQSRRSLQSRHGHTNPVKPYTARDNQGISPIAASDSVSVLLPNSLAVLAPQPRADVTAVAWRVHQLHHERYSDTADLCAARNKQHTYTQHKSTQHKSTLYKSTQHYTSQHMVSLPQHYRQLWLAF